MTYIPIENKISLINKYIQINILHKKGGEIMHVDIPEIEILNAIVDDLKAHDAMLTQPEKSLKSVIDTLNEYRNQQSEMASQLKALMHTLESLGQEDSEQVSLDDIIRSLKEMDQN
jgi:hypothetical protein